MEGDEGGTSNEGSDYKPFFRRLQRVSGSVSKIKTLIKDWENIITYCELRKARCR